MGSPIGIQTGQLQVVTLPTEIPGYRITRLLGVGAASRISLAVEVATNRQVAVKHVLRESAEDDPFIRQVEIEHEVASKADHAYLRKSYAIHRVRKLLQLREVILIMEYVDGLPLDKALPNRLNTFLMLFQRVAVGLDALHDAGYVHSDIKPNNIMIGRKGVVKIIDFGQSCPLGHRKSRIQGTPDYIAPEQVQRLPLDRRTDVYNLGATMYWLLTGENYPTRMSGVGTSGGRQVIASKKAVAPIERNDKIPLALSQLVMESCRENPGERPADMKQVAARLAVIQKLWNKQRDQARAELLASRAPVIDPLAQTVEQSDDRSETSG